MNIVKLPNFARFSRRDFLVFSPEYLLMLEELKTKLQTEKQINLCLVRIADNGLMPTLTKIFNVVSVEENMFTATFIDEHHEDPLTKVIRMDNVLGEIPLLPGYAKSIFIEIGGAHFPGYEEFLVDCRKFLTKHKDKVVSAIYKNDDGSYSVVDGFVREINHGNFLLHDVAETLVRENKTVFRTPHDRNKHHRFISENGFLCIIMLCNRSFSNEDDEQVFGEEKTWNFPEDEMAVA